MHSTFVLLQFVVGWEVGWFFNDCALIAFLPVSYGVNPMVLVHVSSIVLGIYEGGTHWTLDQDFLRLHDWVKLTHTELVLLGFWVVES